MPIPTKKEIRVPNTGRKSDNVRSSRYRNGRTKFQAKKRGDAARRLKLSELSVFKKQIVKLTYRFGIAAAMRRGTANPDRRWFAETPGPGRPPII
jgi:hypothetical protein